MMKSIVIGSLLVLAMGSQVSIADVNRVELQGRIGAIGSDPVDGGGVLILDEPASAGKPSVKLAPAAPADGVKSSEDTYLRLD